MEMLTFSLECIESEPWKARFFLKKRKIFNIYSQTVLYDQRSQTVRFQWTGKDLNKRHEHKISYDMFTLHQTNFLNSNIFIIYLNCKIKNNLSKIKNVDNFPN